MLQNSYAGRSALPAATLLAALCLALPSARAQEVAGPYQDFTGIVKDADWARILGKALFWDTVAGEGTACAGCHLHSSIEKAQASTNGSSERPPMVRAAAVEFARLEADPQAKIEYEKLDPNPPTTLEFAKLDPNPPASGVAVTAQLAEKVLELKPLAAHTLRPDDSLLGKEGPHGNLISADGHGLERTYLWLIQQSFDDKLWNQPERYVLASNGHLVADPKGYSQAEQNFMLFWSVAIRLYESSLEVKPGNFHTCRPEISTDLSTCQDDVTPPWRPAHEREGST